MPQTSLIWASIETRHSMYFNVHELLGFSEANKEPFKMSCGDQQGASMKSSAGRKALGRNRCQEYGASLHWERNQCRTHRRHRRVQSCTIYPSISWHYSTLMYVRYIPLLMDHSGFVCAWRTFQWRPHHHEDCLKMLEAPSSISQRLIIFLRFCINWFAQEKNHSSATNHIISCPACHLQKTCATSAVQLFHVSSSRRSWWLLPDASFVMRGSRWHGVKKTCIHGICRELCADALFNEQRSLITIFVHLRTNDQYLGTIYVQIWTGRYGKLHFDMALESCFSRAESGRACHLLLN